MTTGVFQTVTVLIRQGPSIAIRMLSRSEYLRKRGPSADYPTLIRVAGPTPGAV